MVDTHLAHYGSWTIVVVRDSRDSTWLAQALPQKSLAIEQYIAAARQDPWSILWASDYYASKQEVLADIVECIDSAERERAE
jgi:hypothetical protein